VRQDARVRVLSVDARVTGRDRAALARLVETAGADVACVHNGPHLLRWRSISAALGRRSGLVVVTGGRPAGANLLLSTLAVDVVAQRDLPLRGGSRLHPAGAALAVLRTGGVEFALVAATLIGNAAGRVAQARELLRAVDALTPAVPPGVLCVQGADRPGTATHQTLAEAYVSVGGRFFVDPRITVGATEDVDGYATAVIPPLVLEAELPEQAALTD
jgi:hypothetical protein